jgi:hypothetical protein
MPSLSLADSLLLVCGGFVVESTDYRLSCSLDLQRTRVVPDLVVYKKSRGKRDSSRTPLDRSIPAMHEDVTIRRELQSLSGLPGSREITGQCTWGRQ